MRIYYNPRFNEIILWNNDELESISVSEEAMGLPYSVIFNGECIFIAEF